MMVAAKTELYLGIVPEKFPSPLTMCATFLRLVRVPLESVLLAF